MSQIYSHTDYRSYLRKTIAESAGRERGWGGITRWTTAVGCQRSHGSRVLSGDKDLTREQALATAEFLQLKEAESDYFLLMVDFANAGSKSLREHIHRKLKALKKTQLNLDQSLQPPPLANTTQEAWYYSSWYWSAIHILTSVPGYSTPAKIAAKLSLPVAQVEFALDQLAKAGLVKKQQGHWVFSSSSVHLPKNSPMTSVHHNNWRQRAVANAQFPQSESFHFTTVQSISAADAEKFQAKLVHLIEEYQRMALPSKPEELIALCCDFFKV
jgi:uncharacterized protein (TIGR02147 family)